MSYTKEWWPDVTTPGEPNLSYKERRMDDETRPLQPIRAETVKEDPTGLGDVTWPKALVIVGVTLILALTVVTVVALMVLPPEFWLVKQ